MTKLLSGLVKTRGITKSRRDSYVLREIRPLERGYWLVNYAKVLRYTEQNPVGMWLIGWDDNNAGLFAATKMVTTTVALFLMLALYQFWCRVKATVVAAAVAAPQRKLQFRPVHARARRLPRHVAALQGAVVCDGHEDNAGVGTQSGRPRPPAA